MIKAYAQLPAGQLHYRRSEAEAGPTWLLLHRTAASSAMYEPLIEELQGCRCVAPDTPGFGASFDVPGSPSIDDYAAWIEQFVDALELDKFWIFGHHTGVNIAAELAHRLPDRIHGMALMGITYFTAQQRDQFRPLFTEEYTPEVDGGHLERNWQWVSQLAVNDAGNTCLHQEFLDTTRAYRGRVQAFSAVWDQDLPARLQDVNLPLMLMCAEDEMLHQFFEHTCESLPTATAKTIKEGGSFAPEVAAPELAEYLTNWANESMR